MGKGTRAIAGSARTSNGGNDEAREAFNTALDSLSKWRDEVAAAADRNSGKVTEAMADAAKAVGWPATTVDALKTQLDQSTEIQLQVMDRTMDAWEQMMKKPNTALLNLKGMQWQNPYAQPPFFGGNGHGRGQNPMDPAAMMANPMQFWLQAAEFWRNAWMQPFGGVQQGRSGTDMSWPWTTDQRH